MSSDSGNPRTPRRSSDRTSSGDGQNVDFGAFVSSRVRDSAARLKGDAATPADTPARETPSASSPSGGTTGSGDGSTRRPSRRWRDSVSGSGSAAGGSTRGDDLAGSRVVPLPQPDDDDDGAGGRPPIGAWFREAGEGRPWFIPALIVAAILILLLIIFLLTRIGGGGDSADPTPTQTAESVIENHPVGTQPAPTATTATESQPSNTDEDVTVQSGGDNQRNAPATNPAAEPTSTPDTIGDANLTPTAEVASAASPTQDVALADVPSPVPIGEVAASCPDQCMIRVGMKSSDTGLLTPLGARASFVGDTSSWMVAGPDTIAAIEAEFDDVSLVDTSSDTLYLYAVELPADVSDDALVAEFGEIVDSAGQLRLVRVDSVPARVTSLTNEGYEVTKIAPAPVASTVAVGTQGPITDAAMGSMAWEVSQDRITQIITELMAMGSTDGTGIGSRYYDFDGNQMAADYLYQQLESLGATVWYEDFITPDGYLLVNVVGELPGSDDSAIYGVMAHFDTISNTDPYTSPGADDNATGIAASLEITRILAGYELTHPVRILFSNAEEVGLLGADAWAKRAVAEGVPIEGMFNIDSVGSDRNGATLIFNSDATSAWMQDLMVNINDGYGFGEYLRTLQNDVIVADDNYLRWQGIEAVMIARELYGNSPYHHSSEDLIDYVSIPLVQSTSQIVLLSLAALVQ